MANTTPSAVTCLYLGWKVHKSVTSIVRVMAYTKHIYLFEGCRPTPLPVPMNIRSRSMDRSQYIQLHLNVSPIIIGHTTFIILKICYVSNIKRITYCRYQTPLLDMILNHLISLLHNIFPH